MSPLHRPVVGLSLVAAAVAAALLAPGPARAQGSFEGLGGGGSSSYGWGGSADGAVAVGQRFGSGNGEAFRWTPSGGMEGLGWLAPDVPFSTAYGASADGAVVVGGSQSAAGYEAFRWAAGAMEGLGDLPGGPFRSVAYAASADGSVVVGLSETEDPQQAFRWANGVMAGLGELPGGSDNSVAHGVSADGAVVVGSAGQSGSPWQAFRWSAATGMEGLGGLPGAVVVSEARDVSADGAVVVGGAANAEGEMEAFRWTAGGMEGLGRLPFAGEARALGVSADGAVVVGRHGSIAFIWTPNEGVRILQAVLAAEYGLNLSGWSLWSAEDVSDDGTVIVGWGTNPQGESEAWRAVLPALRLRAPAAGALVVGGVGFPVRWSAPPALGPLELVLLPDTLGAAPTVVASALAPADTAFTWAVPDTVFSRSARLVLRVVADPARADTSGFFRVRPYHLTRLAADGARYDPFRPGRHGWPFGNTAAALFPPEWQALPQFDYAFGPDPLTGSEYDDDFPAPPINAAPPVFADWPAYARAFGADDAYHLVIPFVEAWYRDSFTAAWGAFHGGTPWGGSCSGMAVSALLAFGHREAFGARYPDVGPVDRLFSVGMSVPVREMVNALYAYWPGQLQRQHRLAVGSSTRTPRQTLADLKAMLVAEGRGADGYLYISSGVAGGGAHAVVPYGLRRDPSGPGRWRVLVYDPNRPADSTAAVLLDSTANQWAYAFGLNWGGATGMYVMDPVPNYLAEAAFAGLRPLDAPPAASGAASGTPGGASLYVAAPPGADVALTSAAGAVGYAGGAVLNTLPGAEPDLPPVGGPTPPIGYTVPLGPYDLTLSAFPGERASAYFFGDGVAYAYGRADAGAGQTDLLRYDPAPGPAQGLGVRSDDAGATKAVTLRAVVSGDEHERTLDVGALPLVGADSAGFAAVDGASGPRLHLRNGGAAKAYALRLRQAGAAGERVFVHAGVPLAAGATHVVRADWATLGDGPVEVDVDLDGDGAPEETLVLEPGAVSIGAGGAEGLPAAFALLGPYPNPTGGRTTLPYEVPAAGPVRVAVYDVLGRAVAVLVDERVEAGRHEAVLEAAALPAGTYLVRMAAGGGFQQTRRVTVVR